MRGDGNLYKRGETWWCAFYVDGKQQRESAKTNDEETARVSPQTLKEVHAHECNPAERFLTQRDRRRTIADLIDALKRDLELRGKNTSQGKSNLARVSADFGASRAMNLTAEDVDEYIERRLAEGYAKASINRTTQLLHQAYTLAELPAPRIRRLSEKGNERRGFFSESEIRLVIANLPESLRDFVLFGYLTGMRRGEIASLEWADVDGDTIRLRAENAKTGEGRTLPIVGELAELIARRREARQVKVKGTVVLANLIFHRGCLPIAEFRKSWASACCAAGVGKLVCPKCSGDVDEKRRCAQCSREWKREELNYAGRLFHDLRRSAVRDLIRAGVSAHVAMSISGHKTDSMLRRYDIVDTRDQKAALELRAEYLKTRRGDGVVAMAASR